MPDDESPAPEEGRVEVPAVWVGIDDLPILFTNQLISVVHPNEVFVTFGAVAPPPIMGDSPEERKAQAESIPFVQVNPLVRLAMHPAQLRRVIEILQESLSNYERLTRGQE